MTKLSKYFTEDELRCSCGCGQVKMNPAFLERADRLREKFGKPISPSSGYRCSNHRSERDKKAPGAHQLGRAMDIPCDGQTAFLLMKLAFELGFTGIGVSQNARGARFLHLDDATAADGLPRPTSWSY